MSAGASAQELRVHHQDSEGLFPLVKGKAADIQYDSRDAKVVGIAVDCLSRDIAEVSGQSATILKTEEPLSGEIVVVGTLGKNRLIDQWVQDGKLDVKDLRGKWEHYRITTLSDPSPGVKKALVIVGSDPRGTAYGVFELSKAIGVSPWVWWADVPVRRSEVLMISAQNVTDRPAVKYRGIFINDEGWGLVPWAAKTFEPEVGNLGPKTYSRIFELLLRLKANTLWPAMHPGTTPFHQVPGNAAVADDYSIVLGSSHAEPMLRNNVGEWKQDKNLYNYIKNPEGVFSYWEERVKERTSGESLFTLGMRGIHDSAIVGPKTQPERIATVQKIIADQRGLLAKYLGNGDATRIGQIFCPYKEVLEDYNAGLQVPDDVTLVWPDDNFGYIRRFATPGERKRAGGLGVYYHASYLGAPLSWLWIDTMPPALIWSEMTRAYEQGARTFWILNVGDLKNTERSTEFFLDLAWNADRTAPDAPARFIRKSAERDFGSGFSSEIANILSRLYALNFSRKTEHLQWHLNGKPYQPPTLNETEILQRLEACARLEKDSQAIREKLPPEARDAYFQLVGYPVGITVAANRKYFHGELARADIARGRPADQNEDQSRKGAQALASLTDHYNKNISGGKWRHIAMVNGVTKNNWRRYQPDTTPPPAPTLENVCPPAPEAAGPLSRPANSRPGEFVENGRLVSIHAGHFTGRTDLPSGAGWRGIEGLGRSGNAVTVLPSTAEWNAENAPSLEYRFHTTTAAAPEIHVRLLPTHPLVSGQGLRFAISIDGGKAVPLTVSKGFSPKSTEWSHRVLSNATEISAKLPETLAPGTHTLRLIAIDAGVVVDKIVIDLGGSTPSYEGPAETRIR
ncbi:MAG: glycosyl hydrolase 115 family protein [Luteolibacter sp.]